MPRLCRAGRAALWAGWRRPALEGGSIVGALSKPERLFLQASAARQLMERCATKPPQKHTPGREGKEQRTAAAGARSVACSGHKRPLRRKDAARLIAASVRESKNPLQADNWQERLQVGKLNLRGSVSLGTQKRCALLSASIAHPAVLGFGQLCPGDSGTARLAGSDS